MAGPARSASDLELAWDDAERADGLFQVANLSVVVSGMSLLFWLVFIGEALTSDGFYRDFPEVTATTTVVSRSAFGVLQGLLAAGPAGPVGAWLSGRRRGHEQRQLWAHGVSS